jgi:hypothetical protein
VAYFFGHVLLNFVKSNTIFGHVFSNLWNCPIIITMWLTWTSVFLIWQITSLLSASTLENVPWLMLDARYNCILFLLIVEHIYFISIQFGVASTLEATNNGRFKLQLPTRLHCKDDAY